MAPPPASLSAPNALSLLAPATARVSSGRWNRLSFSVSVAARVVSVAPAAAVTAQRRLVAAAAATEMAPAASGEEGSKPFVEEMRAVAMKLHTKDQAREGEKEPDAPPVAKWEPSVEGYLRFLVDSKLVFQTLEDIVERAAVPWYAEFRNTGLERSEALKKDLEWFRQQGHTIPEPSPPGTTYASLLEELSEKDPQAFICHFYNVYFAHTAGGRMIGKKVSEKILNKKELEFYKWEGNLSQLLQNVRSKLNEVASSWSREEKDHCLEETEKSFAYSGGLLRHMYFPDGIDVYFENVGGEMLEAALANMNTYGRVALSGVIAEYTGGARRAVPDLLDVIYKRITIRGFLAWDFLPKFAEFNAIIAGWIREGKVKVVEDVSDGLESVPSAFAALFRGQNVGKKLVKLA